MTSSNQANYQSHYQNINPHGDFYSSNSFYFLYPQTIKQQSLIYNYLLELYPTLELDENKLGNRIAFNNNSIYEITNFNNLFIIVPLYLRYMEYLDKDIIEINQFICSYIDNTPITKQTNTNQTISHELTKFYHNFITIPDNTNPLVKIEKPYSLINLLSYKIIFYYPSNFNNTYNFSTLPTNSTILGKQLTHPMYYFMQIIKYTANNQPVPMDTTH